MLMGVFSLRSRYYDQDFQGSATEDRGLEEGSTWLPGLTSKLIKLAIWAALIYGVLLSYAIVDQPIKRIAINDQFTHLEKETLQEQMRNLIVNSILMIDLSEVTAKLAENSWVYRAYVRRIWPDMLSIYILKQTPIAIWRQYSEVNCEAQPKYCGYINQRGELFSSLRDNRFPDSMPVLIGPPKQSKAIIEHYLAFKQVLERSSLSIKQLQRDKFGFWSLGLANNIKVFLGQHDLMTKISTLHLLWERQLQHEEREIRSIDLRYSDGAAVTWKVAEL